jgi:putative tryptophan/tyrosine transport system substrate-binding protein
MRSDRLKRRDFITLLGGAAAWPLTARAQVHKPATIGFLASYSPATQRRWNAVFVKRLQELGWTDGGNVVIEYRWSDGDPNRAAEIAAEFVRMKVDVLVTAGTAPALALKNATATIPIVVATMGDPLGTGLVTSLARPGANVTGLSVQQAELGSKRLDLLREMVPGLTRLAIIANAGAPVSLNELREVRTLAGPLGIELASFEINHPREITRAFDAFRDRVQALYVVSDPLISIERGRICLLAAGARLPTIHAYREYAEAGGLISYGTSFPEMFRRTAVYVDKILRGGKPADLPVEQPTKFELVINLIAAKAIGFDVPPMLLARADEVIE